MRINLLALLAMLAMFSLVPLSGCVGYHVYPPEEGLTGISNPNSSPIPDLAVEALTWTATRYPPTGGYEWTRTPASLPNSETKFVINLPSGFNELIYRGVARSVSDNVSATALPMEPGLESLPTYHVARFYVMGDEAKVDVIRPISGMPGNTPDSTPITQGITLHLRGGVSPWRVTSHTTWTPGALAVPPINYVPAR